MFTRFAAVAITATLLIAACGSDASFSDTPTSTVGSTSAAAPSSLPVDTRPIPSLADRWEPPITPVPTTQPPATAPVTLPPVTAQETQDWGKCGEWHDLAIAVGWPEDQWPILSKVMYRESRCHIDSINPNDVNGGSFGLLQINGYWCKPSRYSERGWLQDQGVLTSCADLLTPEVNLRAGLAMWLYGELKHGCGWRGPWVTPCATPPNG